ncbi:cyclically-permuted mutarotase family protein [Daejeonella rubra]|uniref:Cyclically-permuted mutarotase family protein n=1 Tax=Daejeonella rubra TaxID=990371 RepID=A0A1G9W767_9SPHI|nr:kelch repeat-containing protein [Daejeonella rubra]SDM80382.1 cyclically-permuted mutarotase family protein [Daejeonella rubra]
MNKFLFSLSLFIMIINTEAFSQEKAIATIQWEKIATLENADGSRSIGLAGAINAVYDHALLIAGGANFPDKMPWEGGKKHYSDEINILQKLDGKYVWNKKINAKLPEPIAYCGNTSTQSGIIYAGGENAAGLSKKAFLIKLNSGKGKLMISALPDLPDPLTNIFLCNIGNVVYAIGGDGPSLSSPAFLSLDLDKKEEGWKQLPNMPIALANSAAVVQNGPEGVNIYVVGGRSKDPSGISELHNTLFIYNPQTKTWKSGAPISDGSASMNFSAGAAVPLADHLVLIAGGDNGKVFHQIETYLVQIAQAKSSEEKESLVTKKNHLVINHQGFDKALLLYDTKANTWNKIEELPFPAHVTTTATKWGECIVLSSGEIKPGVRTPNIMLGKPVF